MARSDVRMPVAVVRVIPTAVAARQPGARATVQPLALVMADILVGQAVNGGCAPR